VKVSIVNINNGERFDTYAIKGELCEITLNGPLQERVQETISLLSFRMPQWV
jgi:aspartate 1-decarboxylase